MTRDYRIFTGPVNVHVPDATDLIRIGTSTASSPIEWTGPSADRLGGPLERPIGSTEAP